MDKEPGKRVTVETIGTVKSYDDGSGNGIIAREDDTDVFVNREAIRGDGPPTLKVGSRVRVAVMEGPNGPRAVTARKL